MQLQSSDRITYAQPWNLHPLNSLLPSDGIQPTAAINNATGSRGDSSPQHTNTTSPWAILWESKDIAEQL